MLVRFVRIDGSISEVEAKPGDRLLEVAQADGQPLEGFGHDECDLAIANGVDIEATWRGRNVESLVGHRIRLHIHIRYGTLYAYRFASREPSRGE